MKCRRFVAEVSDLIVSVNNQSIAHFARKQLIANFINQLIVKDITSNRDVILYANATILHNLLKCCNYAKPCLFYLAKRFTNATTVQGFKM